MIKSIPYNYKPISLAPKTNSLNREEHDRMISDLSKKSVPLSTYMDFCIEMYKSHKTDSLLYKQIFDKLQKENKQTFEFLHDQNDILKFEKKNNLDFGRVKKMYYFLNKWKDTYKNWFNDNKILYDDCAKYLTDNRGNFSLNESTDAKSNNKLLKHIKELAVFMNDNFMELKPYPKLVISTDDQFIDDILGPTAHYDMDEQIVKVYVAGRHIIDICKSVIHEWVHHHQFLNDELTPDIQSKLGDPEYMKNNPELLALEQQAYEMSGIIFRFWRDSKRSEG